MFNCSFRIRIVWGALGSFFWVKMKLREKLKSYFSLGFKIFEKFDLLSKGILIINNSNKEVSYFNSKKEVS